MLPINAPSKKIWKIISDVDNDPVYWKGITLVRNISHNGNTITREIRFPDGNSGQQTVTLYPNEIVQTRWTKGPISGVKDIMLIYGVDATIIHVKINYNYKRFSLKRSENILEKIQSETELALQLIKKRAECKRTNICSIK